MEEKRQAAIDKLKELVEGIDFCMLTTLDGGHLRSRPMSTQELEFGGDLWFFTCDESHKVEELSKDDRVNVAYSKPENNTYVPISGRAAADCDTIGSPRQRYRRFWRASTSCDVWWRSAGSTRCWGRSM